MKKVSLLLALALSSTMVFAGCGYTNQPETFDESETSVVSRDSDDTIANDIVNTTWVLTDIEHSRPHVEASSEEPSEILSGEKKAKDIGLSLEFKEDNKVTMTSNYDSKEFTYSNIHNQEGTPCISIAIENSLSLTGVIEDNIMTFPNLLGNLFILEKQ